VARIDCNDCKKWAYDLKTGEKILHGGDPIPVRKAPCEQDEKICPKGKPGHSDLTAENLEIFRLYRFCKSIDEWPDDIEFRRYRSLLEEIERVSERRAEKRDQYRFLVDVMKATRRR
jgi:hypothetical protein